jgi:uncharacterized protein YjbI with pentapeptide repeats
MIKEQLTAILAGHEAWLRGKGGQCADLSGADLTGANLSGADLSGADLTGAYLTGADLSGALIEGETVINLLRRATRSDGYEFFLWHCKEGFFIKAGCRFMDMKEARQHWKTTRGGTPLGDETMDILQFFAAAIKRAAPCAS